MAGHNATVTPEDFITRWAGARLTERASAQSHFNDLCRLLDEPTPHEADPTGEHFAFERGVTKTAGGRGFADVWKRNHFALEYKAPGANIGQAFEQLQRYALSLENPPILAVCDLVSFTLRTNWTNTVSQTHTIRVSDLRDPQKLRLLKWMLSDPERLRPDLTREKLTRDAADEFVQLARRLRTRGHDPYAVAHFVNRLVFCLFADKAGLLPAGLLEKLLAAGERRPPDFAALTAQLFAQMKDGGYIGFDHIPWFNGGLFDDDATLPLFAPDIASIRKAAKLDWAAIEPSIFGTLFERGLDPEKEKQIGAHYTDAAKIDLILQPVLVRPLAAEWDFCRVRIAGLLAERAPLAALDLTAEATPPKRRNAERLERERRAEALRIEAEGTLTAFLERLRAFRVLDPACGSGNFLYLALIALKDLERRAIVEAEALGLARREPTIGPEAVLGIELNPFAAELARVSVWIGAIQWTQRHGFALADNPILKPLDHIACRDALLNADFSRAVWPAADVIVGNPPFVGDKAMRRELGDTYTERLRAAYDGEVPGAADLVCYWFHKARAAMVAGSLQRAGLVATQSIRKGASRVVLDRIVADAVIFDAWDDEAWTVEGAAVRVALVCFGTDIAEAERFLDGQRVSFIAADLAAAAAGAADAIRLPNNRGICLQGPVKVGAFDVDEETALRWLEAPLNPNGRPNADVVRPWVNGEQITRRAAPRWIIDFAARSEADAAYYSGPFGHVLVHVKPERLKNRDAQRSERWWHLGRSGADLRRAMSGIARFIATPRVAKHRLFVWCPTTTLPDSRVYAIARDDDTTFGILHSRFHEAWSIRLGSWHGKGNDPTYNNQTCFETYPFPEHLTPNLAAKTYAQNSHAIAIAAAAKTLVEKRDAWLNPPDLIEKKPEIVPGFPDRLVPKNPAAEKTLRKRTLTNLYNTRFTPEGAWLDALHATLDAAVAAAYGFPENITTEDALARLLALNHARAATKPEPTPRRATDPTAPSTASRAKPNP